MYCTHMLLLVVLALAAVSTDAFAKRGGELTGTFTAPLSAADEILTLSTDASRVARSYGGGPWELAAGSGPHVANVSIDACDSQGCTIVVKGGTVLAMDAIDGTASERSRLRSPA